MKGERADIHITPEILAAMEVAPGGAMKLKERPIEGPFEWAAMEVAPGGAMKVFGDIPVRAVASCNGGRPRRGDEAR